MRIIKREAKNISEKKIFDLFFNYPFKKFQQNFQSIDKSLLAGFFLKELKQKIEKKETTDPYYWEVVNHNEPLAIFVLELLPRHSVIFGQEMWNLSTILNYRQPAYCFNLFWNEILERKNWLVLRFILNQIILINQLAKRLFVWI